MGENFPVYSTISYRGRQHKYQLIYCDMNVTWGSLRMIDKVPPPSTAPPLACPGPPDVLVEPGFALELPRNFTSSEVDGWPLWPTGWTWSLFPNRTKSPLWRSPDLPATRMKQCRLVALWFLGSPGAKEEEGHMHPTPNFHVLLQLPLWEGTWLC